MTALGTSSSSTLSLWCFLLLLFVCAESQNVCWTSLTSHCIVLHRGRHCKNLGLNQRRCYLRNHGNSIVWWIYGNMRRLSTFSYFTCFIHWKNILDSPEYQISQQCKRKDTIYTNMGVLLCWGSSAVWVQYSQCFGQQHVSGQQQQRT